MKLYTTTERAAFTQESPMFHQELCTVRSVKEGERALDALRQHSSADRFFIAAIELEDDARTVHYYAVAYYAVMRSMTTYGKEVDFWTYSRSSFFVGA